jgi:HAD superfamily hydrolase (TIGR01509 family)
MQDQFLNIKNGDVAMKAEAMLFDKDGTLMDFDAFWVPVSEKAMDTVLMQLQMDRALTKSILEAIGVHNGVTDIDSVLCKGTYGQIGQIVHHVVCQYGREISRETVTELVVSAYNAAMDAGQVRPTCLHLAEILQELKNRGIKLAVVTTDNDVVTANCLRKLGIADLFDRVYTDDGKTPTKPDPWCADDFCRQFCLEKGCAVMVGDTLTDVHFAQNAGIQVVGVAAREENRRLLAGQANLLVSSLSELPDVLT